MYKINHNTIPHIILPYILGAGFIVGGIFSIPHQKQCNLSSTYHVHLYTKDIENVSIKKWLHKEDNTFSYIKHSDLLPATTFDIEVYDKLEEHDLFDGRNNIDFINYQISRYRDYMEFYYYYEDIYYITNEDGELEEVRTVYEGWTSNPWERGVTGKVRVIHKRYYAYNIIYNNGELELEKSEIVDDIRTVINDYPYISESTNKNVQEIFMFRSYELPYLNLEDFDPFYTPTVEDNPLENLSSSKNNVEKKLTLSKSLV